MDEIDVAAKAYPPMDLTDAGMENSVSPVQFLKAEAPIVVAVGAMVILVSISQLINADVQGEFNILTSRKERGTAP